MNRSALVRAALVILVSGARAHAIDDPPVLTVGVPFEGVIDEDAPAIELADPSYASTDPVARRYRLRVQADGAYFIELRSYSFDAYLILRDESGAILAEDDDGLLGTHSRIAVDELHAGPTYTVDVCALHRLRGPFDVRIVAGRPPELAPHERTEAEFADARKSVEMRERTSGADSLEVAASLETLALLFHREGQYEAARPHFERVLSIREKILGPEHARLAQTLTDLGDVLMGRGRYDEARTMYERALAIDEKAQGPDHLDTATSLNNLAILLFNQGHYDEARQRLERALAIQEKQLGPEHAFVATSLNNLATLLWTQGKFDDARRRFERALAIREKRLGPDHPQVSICLQALAGLFKDQGRYDEARPLFERALAIDEATLGPKHPGTSMSLNNLANVFLYEDRYDEARPLYERALAIDEATLGPKHPATVSTLSNLAHVLRGLGEYDAARRHYERTLATCEEVLGPEHPDTAQSLSDLARLLRDLGEYDEARRLYTRALAIRDKVLGAEHPRTTVSLDDLAKLLADIGEPRAAWDLLRRARRGRAAHLQHALAGLSEQEALRYVHKLFSQQETALSLAGLIDDPVVRREAYEGLLTWKGRVTRLARQSRDRSLAELTAEQAAVIDALRAVQGELSALVLRESVADRAARDAQLEELCTRRNELELRWQRMAEARDRPEVTFDQLRRGLPVRSAIVDFFVHRVRTPARWDGNVIVENAAWSAPRLSAWITRGTADAPVHIDLGPAATVEAAAHAFLEDLVARRGVRRDEPARVRDLNAELRTLIWDPIAALLGDAEFVFLSPDGFVGTLPFETMQQDDRRYLIERFAFVYLQDVTTLADMEDAAPRAFDSLLSVGGVDFMQRDADETLLASAATHADVLRGSFTEFWGRLPATEYESQVVCDMHRAAVPGGRHTLVQGAAATEERMKRELPAYAVLHLATHGFFQPEGLPSMWEQVRGGDGAERGRMQMRAVERRITGNHPGLLSGLVFAGASLGPETERDDGYLTAEEVSWLDLSDVRLVVLSACDTGLGRAASGEGLIGLRRAFRTAGADCVISSLWSVRDHATSELMQAFYRNLLLKKMGTLEALRSAQLDALNRSRMRHDGDGRPSTWGAFVLDGDWR